jgi:hypothetical protein
MAYGDTKAVLFTGTARTNYDQGIGVCYNRDYGTATDTEGERDVRVEVPSRSNNRDFAGVLSEAITTNGDGNAWTRIFEPGSVCEIAVAVDTVVNTGRITCLAAGGDNTSRFWAEGFVGRGSAKPLETVTAVLESDLTGTGSLLATDGLTLTVADSSDYTAGSTKVLMLGGEDDATGALQKGLYGIASITNDTTIVLDSIALDVVSTGAITCSFVIIDEANDRCLAYLEDGGESGLTDVLEIANAGSGALTYMVGGFTYVNGGVDIAADGDVDLADGSFWYEKKGFILLGDLATSDFTLDLVSNGIQLDGSSALQEVLTIDDDGDGWIGEWVGSDWYTRDLLVGATEG